MRFQRGARALQARQAGAEGGDSGPGTCRGGLGGGVGSSQVRGLHRCVKPRVVAGCPVQRAARVHLLLWGGQNNLIVGSARFPTYLVQRSVVADMGTILPYDILYVRQPR